MVVETHNVVVAPFELQLFSNQSRVVAELTSNVDRVVGICLGLKHALSPIPHTTY